MEAIILSGIQGAGKSTFCKDIFWDTHIRLNYDMLRTRYRERLLLEAMISAKQPFVVDGTNPTEVERALYINAVKHAGFFLKGIQFYIDLENAITRNALRDPKRRVPDKAIKATIKKMTEMRYEEGFDLIIKATVSADTISLTEIPK